jgi:hypothetical protein
MGKDDDFKEDEGTVRDDVSPEDILGAPDDDLVPADDNDEPEGDAAPTGDGEGTDEGEGVAQDAPESGEEPPPATTEADAQPVVEEPVPVTFDDGAGGTYEVMMSPAAAKVQEKQKTTALQFPALQEKHLLERQAREELEARMSLQTPADQPGTTVNAEGQPQFSQEQFEREMQPRVDHAVKSGTITEGFAKEFPSETAYGVWLFDAVNQMAGKVNTVSASAERDEKTEELNDFKRGVHGEMSGLATADPQIFGELATEDKREAFFDFVYEANPTVGQLSGEHAVETLKGLFAWYKKDEMQAGITAATVSAKADSEKNRLLAGGAGGGGGSRSKPKPKHQDIEDVLGD